MENNKNIKVSIIVATYNVEEYVIKALKSITNQTLKEIEIIIVDDASTDNTLSLVNSYLSSDSRIQVIKHNVNQGVGVARNSGIAKAQGEYIGFIDPDDYISEDYFKTLYDTAKKYDADLSCGLTITVTKEGISKNQQRSFSMHESLLKKPIIETYLDKQYIIYNAVSTNKIYKRDFINKNNIRFPGPNIYYEDTFFTFVSVALSNKIAINANAYYYYVQRQDSLTKIAFTNKKHFDIFTTLEMSQNWLRDTKLLSEPHKHHYQAILNTQTINTLCIFYAGIQNEDERKEFLHRATIVLASIDLSNTINLHNSTKNIYHLILNPGYIITIKFMKLTLMKIIYNKLTLKYKLFSILNLLEITYSVKKTSYLLFKYIPVFKVKTKLNNNNIKKYYLLGVKIYNTKLTNL